ncbi:transposase [Streptomyces sp. NPDC021080]|uniref:transposase n=1 Tax=Streptomyces sp. NPDC021080 TaxID=3365110 RepID=UPI0037A47C0C
MIPNWSSAVGGPWPGCAPSTTALSYLGCRYSRSDLGGHAEDHVRPYKADVVREDAGQRTCRSLWLTPSGHAPSRYCRIGHRRGEGGGGITSTDAIAFKYHTGTPWMDLPEHFGSWKGAHNRLRTWAADGTWEKVFTSLLTQADVEGDPDWVVAVDSTIVRAHQHAARARQKEPGSASRPTMPSTIPQRADHEDPPRRGRPLQAPRIRDRAWARSVTHPHSSRSWLRGRYVRSRAARVTAVVCEAGFGHGFSDRVACTHGRLRLGNTGGQGLAGCHRHVGR